MISPGKYELEYRDQIKEILRKYIEEIEKQEAEVWQMDEYRVKEEILEKYLGTGCGWKKHYEKERKNGKAREEAGKKLEEWLRNYILPSDYQKGEVLWTNFGSHLWYNALSVYQKGRIVYVTQEKQLDGINPVLEEAGGPVVLLSEFEIPEDKELPDTVVGIEVEFTGEGRFTNVFLECNFPLIFQYFNLFDLLAGILRPQEIIKFEENDFQEEIWKEIGRVNRIPLKLLKTMEI